MDYPKPQYRAEAFFKDEKRAPEVIGQWDDMDTAWREASDTFDARIADVACVDLTVWFYGTSTHWEHCHTFQDEGGEEFGMLAGGA